MDVVFFPLRVADDQVHAIQDSQATQDLEAIMKKEIFQENKARWEVFEWIGTTQSKIVWAVAAVIVVLGIVYLVR